MSRGAGFFATKRTRPPGNSDPSRTAEFPPAAIIGAMSRPRHGAPENAALVEQCCVASNRLLSRNLRKEGILAASPTPKARSRHYNHVFARDAGVCALAMARSGNARLIEGARAGLRTLARHQAANGQIPKFVESGGEGADFWYVGCIDATLWWLIAAWHVSRLAPDAAFKREMAGPTRRALAWAACQEHPRLRLVTQNEASDWADIMPRSGFVLYLSLIHISEPTRH